MERVRMNIFDVLSIDDDELEDSSTTPTTTTVSQNITLSKAISSSTCKNIYEVETTYDELIFALFCFFDDLDRIRLFLLKLWPDYRCKRLDLIL